MRQTPHLDIIGVPFCLGGSKDGPARGPEALMEHGLVDVLSQFVRNVRYVNVVQRSDREELFSRRTKKRGRLHSSSAVKEVCRLAGAHVFSAHRLGHFPLVIGGDHSVSMGTLPQILDPALSGGRKVGCVWIDAHFDAHTPKTSHSQYANGLPLASVLGYGPSSFACFRRKDGRVRKRLRYAPNLLLHIGAGESDCEPEELALLQKLNVPMVTMRDIHQKGVPAFMAPLARLLDESDDIVLTLDLDAVRKDFAPGVSFPSKAGMLPSHLSLIARLIAESGKLRQIEIMEYNPDFEEYNMHLSPMTAHIVFDILSLLLNNKNPHA